MDIKLFQKAAYREGEKISIIIPCYNREMYIKECLESVLLQTIPLDLIEIIIVNDCSTDKTLSILMDYESKYPENILVVNSEVQSGGYIGRVRNIGLNYASGGYIFFLDSDDSIFPETLEKLYVQAVIHNADIIECNYIMQKDGVNIGGSQKKEMIYDTNNNTDFAALILDDGMDGWVWGKLYKHSFLIEQNIIFPEDLRVAEDTFFHLSCLFSLKKLIVLSDALYNYSYNPAGAWNSDKTLNYISDCFEAQKRLYPIYKKATQISEYVEWLAYGAVFGLKRKCTEANNPSVFETILPDIKTELIKEFPSLKHNQLIRTDKSSINSELWHQLFDS